MTNNRNFSIDQNISIETKSNDQNIPNLHGFTNKKIHPAIKYFRQLQTSTPSGNLKKLLSSFNISRAIDADTFAKGVKKFITLANSNPIDHNVSEHNRNTLYGNSYLGLHYNNDLVKLWNSSNTSDEPIKASDVATLAPSKWNVVMQDGFTTIIYKGDQTAEALDQLVLGPTVIDCGMFTQLSFWFGIRYMLGNEKFNQCFGRAPFFITQMVYNTIEQSNQPYSGNPLYSFLSKKEQVVNPAVSVKHITNTPLYPFKHPGGNYGGENCILIENKYYIFDPHLHNTQALKKSDVLHLLRSAFNEGRTQPDADRLALYALHPILLHCKLIKSYGELIKTADDLKDKTLTEDEFLNTKQNHSLELTFDLQKFSKWLQMMESKDTCEQAEYLPTSISNELLPVELLNVIPFENKTSMDFFQFKQETPQQKELTTISKQFCQHIMSNQSKLVVLTGKAGVGKTASAVCAAKELAANGKKVAWISEVMVHGWADQAKSMADLDNCGKEIDKLLASNPDAVFLDDDNLAGFSGNLLLEKIYAWYVRHPGRGLFITSNEPICFIKCYGYKLDSKYHYPPFSDYYSPQYINWQHKTNLAGESLRTKRDGQSIGAIVSDAAWKINESSLKGIELIPGFDEKNELVPIRQSLRKTGFTGDVYNKLRPIQQKWIDVYTAGGNDRHTMTGRKYIEPYLTANPNKFEKTNAKTIALEIKEFHSNRYGKEIDRDSINQLIRILNYAHDQGGRRVILINQTDHSTDQLLAQIKSQLPKSESERTWSRLNLLLCETEDSIFTYDQFNGSIESGIHAKKMEANNQGITENKKELFLLKKTPEDIDLSSRIGIDFFKKQNTVEEPSKFLTRLNSIFRQSSAPQEKKLLIYPEQTDAKQILKNSESSISLIMHQVMNLRLIKPSLPYLCRILW